MTLTDAPSSAQTRRTRRTRQACQSGRLSSHRFRRSRRTTRRRLPPAYRRIGAASTRARLARDRDSRRASRRSTGLTVHRVRRHLLSCYARRLYKILRKCRQLARRQFGTGSLTARRRRRATSGEPTPRLRRRSLRKHEPRRTPGGAPRSVRSRRDPRAALRGARARRFGRHRATDDHLHAGTGARTSRLDRSSRGRRRDRSDDDLPGVDGLSVSLQVRVSPNIVRATLPDDRERTTEWVLMTSGTTAAPKMACHTLATLTAPIRRAAGSRATSSGVRSTTSAATAAQFCCARSLAAVRSFCRVPASRPADFLGGSPRHGATHVSGTPSHWRRALMSPPRGAIAPHYIRLSGEIADQAIARMRCVRSIPTPRLAHAFASTEAGVGFEVERRPRGISGGPAARAGADVEIKVEDGSLRIRSARTALGYFRADGAAVADADGFVDTGDIVERRGDRYYFLGRRTGAINVGGLKVHPEEVEATINRHPRVRMSMVRARSSPITGALVAADSCCASPQTAADDGRGSAIREILATLPASAAAAQGSGDIRFVPSLDLAATGKLARHGRKRHRHRRQPRPWPRASFGDCWRRLHGRSRSRASRTTARGRDRARPTRTRPARCVSCRSISPTIDEHPGLVKALRHRARPDPRARQQRRARYRRRPGARCRMHRSNGSSG